MLTWIELSASNFNFNIDQFRRHIGEKSLLMPVIKANAYGHGLAEIGTLADKHPAVNKLCVASLSEALDLRHFGITKPIVVLSYFDRDENKIRAAIEQNIALPLFSREEGEYLRKVGERLGITIPVHVKIDTGTSRIGVRHDAIEEILPLVLHAKTLRLEGTWTHFASSEENEEFTMVQLERFTAVLDKFAAVGVNPGLRHAACTAATMLLPVTHLDAVRVGIGIYGVYPSSTTKTVLPLKPVLSLHTRLIQTKRVAEGTAVGYGQTHVFRKSGILGVLPVGYADGFDRRFSNKGLVLINGKRFPVRGRVCMNLTMVELTGMPEIQAGDEVILLGSSGNETISAGDWAELQGNTLSYEVISRLGAHIPRIIST